MRGTLTIAALVFPSLPGRSFSTFPSFQKALEVESFLRMTYEREQGYHFQTLLSASFVNSTSTRVSTAWQTDLIAVCGVAVFL